jgi:hypothetical protein
VSARVPRVPLEDVAVGSKVRVWRWDREGDEGIAGVVTFQGKRHWRDAQSITGLDDDDVGFIHGRWLAEVIDAPAPQQPRGEGADARLVAAEPCPACHKPRLTSTEYTRRLQTDKGPEGETMGDFAERLGHEGWCLARQDDSCWRAEIARLRADLAYFDRQQALRDAATGKVAGHAERCGCHGCVTWPLRVEVERLTAERTAMVHVVYDKTAEAKRLRDALWKYGQHLYACTSSECRCGLAAAIKDQP